MKPNLSLAGQVKPKIISGISIIFDWGGGDRGRSYRQFNQADVVDTYGTRMIEELEYENVRTYHIDTRKAPVRTIPERLADVPANFVPVFLSCDWHDKARLVNSSSVEYSGDYYKLADDLCFALSEWGRAYVFGHRVLRPVSVEGSGFIRIKPFALNGPHAEEYVQRLDKLGCDLGRAIGDHLAQLGQGLRR